MDTIMAFFFQNQIVFFNFQKRAGKAYHPRLLVARMWVWMNMHQYIWISLNVLEMLACYSDYAPALWVCLVILHVWQAFEDALGSECVRSLNMTRLYMQGLHRVLHMSEHTSKYAWICLNVRQYAWTWLDITEYPLICLNKLFWLCQGSQYASSS